MRRCWSETSDLPTAIRLCERFNRSRLYEIFGQYAELSEPDISDRNGRAWLYFEDDGPIGVALGARVGGRFVLEECWAPCDGGAATDVGLGPPA